MPEWTRKERRDYIKKKYTRKWVKAFVLAVYIIVIFMLLYGVVSSFLSGNYLLTLASIIGLVMVIPLGIFWLNLYLYEGD